MGLQNFEISGDGLFKLAKFLGFVHWTCILPSFLCLVLALFIQIAIQSKVAFVEDYNGAVLPVFLLFTGFFGFIVHIVSGKIAYTCRRVEKRKKWARFLLAVVIATVILFLMEFTAGIMCFAHISSLEDGFDLGIRKAMGAYKDDATTKEQMDTLQMTFGCCGSRSYRDWFTIEWIHPDFEGDGDSRLNDTY